MRSVRLCVRHRRSVASQGFGRRWLGGFFFFLSKNNSLRSGAPPPPHAAESGAYEGGAFGSRVRRGPAEVSGRFARSCRLRRPGDTFPRPLPTCPHPSRHAVEFQVETVRSLQVFEGGVGAEAGWNGRCVWSANSCFSSDARAGRRIRGMFPGRRGGRNRTGGRGPGAVGDAIGVLLEWRESRRQWPPPRGRNRRIEAGGCGRSGAICEGIAPAGSIPV